MCAVQVFSRRSGLQATKNNGQKKGNKMIKQHKLPRIIRTKLIAVIIAGMGILNVLSSLLFYSPARLEWLRNVIPTDITQGARGLNVVAGFFLIATAWKLGKFSGMIPLFAAIGYFLINALVRNSGGRYSIPIDWAGIFYYSIGLGQLTLWGVSLYWKIPLNLTETQTGFQEESAPQKKFLAPWIAAGIFIFGCILPIAEKAVPPRYTAATQETKLQSLLESNLSNQDQLKTLIANGGKVLQGRALYPRYIRASEMGSVWNAYQHRPYKHIDFYLSSPHDIGIVLPIIGQPDHFPHAADVLVFGCPKGDYIDALAVVIFSEDGEPNEVLVRFPIPEQPACPLPSPD